MSMKNGGPAFPLQSIGPEFAPGYAGMSLRDYFAAKAMQAFVRTLCDKDLLQDRKAGDLIATLSYIQADAMLAERERSIP